MAMAGMLVGAQKAIQGMRWGGQRPVLPMLCFRDSLTERLIACKTHPRQDEGLWIGPYTIFVKGVDTGRYMAEQVLRGIHNSQTGNVQGPFPRSCDALMDAIASAGSLNAVKAGTVAGTQGAAYVDEAALDLELLQSRTIAGDVYEDWPLKFMMHSGYSFWSVPDEVFYPKSFLIEKRPVSEFGEEGHSCLETVALDRPKFIRMTVNEGASGLEAEQAADAVVRRFKVPVELDLSSFGMPNCLLFMPPRNAKNPSKVEEEMKSQPELLAMVGSKLDMTRMRLVPHPRFVTMKCNSTNWYKVARKDQVLSWEAEKGTLIGPWF